jgi:ATP-dependent RNA helicase RhlB
MTDESYLTDVPVARLGLLPELQQGMDAAGFRYCTRIQAEALPLALAGHDVAGQAQTGTGKTAAFLLATMQRLLSHEPAQGHEPGQPRAVILAPTRELAVQIGKDAVVLGQFTGLRVVVVYGGEGYDQQREALGRGVDILVGTPGRLIDFFRQHLYGFRGVEVAVLDEADRMFDLGFLKDIRFILRRLPPPERRLNMLFSATLSYRVTELAYEHMNNPAIVNVATADRVTAENVSQVVYHVAADEKMALLVGLMRHMDPKRSLVFTNTRRAADRVRDVLVANGFAAEVLSGDVPQTKRLRLLGRFSSGDLPILVATDVAARGLHIPDVSHVFNFDLPQDAEDYVHRIGRTARAGASGDAVSLACDEYVFSLPDIEAFIGHKLPVAAVTQDLLEGVTIPPRRRRPPGETVRGRDRRSGREGRPGAREGRPRGLRRSSPAPSRGAPAAKAPGGGERPPGPPEGAEPNPPPAPEAGETSGAPGGSATTETPRRRRRRRPRKPGPPSPEGAA